MGAGELRTCLPERRFRMVVEYVRYVIAQSKRRAFEAAFERAEKDLKTSPHCSRYELSHCVEEPQYYVLRIEWDSIDAHLRDFGASPEFRTYMDAMKPFLSEEQLKFHYGKHHAAYFKNLNALVEGKPEAAMPLREVVIQSAGGLFNNAAQAFNHSFYWDCMSPQGGGDPTMGTGEQATDLSEAKIKSLGIKLEDWARLPGELRDQIFPDRRIKA